MNWLEKSARWLPDRSCTPLVATTVTVVDPGSVPPYSVTVRLSAEIEFTPPTRAVPFTNSAIVLLPFTVAAFSDFENVTTTHGFNVVLRRLSGAFSGPRASTSRRSKRQAAGDAARPRWG